jgi:hypothetical protein
MNTNLDLNQTLTLLLLGGLLGIVGQGIRIVVGLKKSNDEAIKSNKSFKECFDTQKLVVSIIIGFIVGAVAGMLGAINMVDQKITKESLLSLIGIGYAGTDFIEGFINKYLPAEVVPKPPVGPQPPNQPVPLDPNKPKES